MNGREEVTRPMRGTKKTKPLLERPLPDTIPRTNPNQP